MFWRIDAGHIGMRNGSNPQTFSVANTDDGAGNYERGVLKWESNELVIETEAGGTGIQRNIRLDPGATGDVTIGPSGSTGVRLQGGYSSGNYLDLNGTSVTLSNGGAVGWPLKLISVGNIEIAPGSGRGMWVSYTSKGSASTDALLHVDGDLRFRALDAAPTLNDNLDVTYELTSNTNLRIHVRGTDGVTRTADITLS